MLLRRLLSSGCLARRELGRTPFHGLGMAAAGTREAEGFDRPAREGLRYPSFCTASAPCAEDETRVVEDLSPRRSVIQLRGADRYSFLQGLVTNDVEELEREPSGSRRCMYSLLLNHKGRFLHDLFVYNVGDGSSLLIDLHKPSLDSVVKVLTRYKLRSKVDILDVTDRYSVVYSSSLGGAEGLAGSLAFKDPRHDLLGYRCLVEQPPGSVGGEGSGPSAHAALRYTLGVPEGDREMPTGKAIPLEFNVDALNGISYTKGCYMGQELTARTHFQGLVRKRLVPVTIKAAGDALGSISRALSGEGGEESELEVVDPERNARKGGRKVGALLAAQDGKGLALLRLKGLKGKEFRLRWKGGSAEDVLEAAVEPALPEWWPEDWYAKAQEE